MQTKEQEEAMAEEAERQKAANQASGKQARQQGRQLHQYRDRNGGPGRSTWAGAIQCTEGQYDKDEDASTGSDDE